MCGARETLYARGAIREEEEQKFCRRQLRLDSDFVLRESTRLLYTFAGVNHGVSVVTLATDSTRSGTWLSSATCDFAGNRRFSGCNCWLLYICEGSNNKVAESILADEKVS